MNNQHEPLVDSYRCKETDTGMSVWLKAGGFNSASYDFVMANPSMSFVGLKWEWNGDLKVDFNWVGDPRERGAAVQKLFPLGALTFVNDRNKPIELGSEDFVHD